MRRLLVMLVLVLGGLGATAAFASPPSDQGPFPLSSVPDCKTGAPDTGGAHICKVRVAIGGNWQAGTGEWIVVRLANGLDTQAKCLSDQASIVATITIDGTSLPVDVISCAFNADSGLWFVDYRALSQPLPKGEHAISESFYYTTDSNGVTAGTTETFTATLAVSNPG